MPAKKRTTSAEPSINSKPEHDQGAKTVGAAKAAPRARKIPEKIAAGAKPSTPDAPVKKARAPRRAATPRKRPSASAAAPVPEKQLRILMVTPEAHPFAKTGGLAEVSAALPAALSKLGQAVTLVLPRYRGAAADDFAVRPFAFALGSTQIAGRFLERQLPDGVRAVLVDIPSLFDRSGLYGDEAGRDYPDNALRFAALSRAALEYARFAGERLDIIHAHDWQTGLVPVYQKMHLSNDPVVGGVPAVFTIHNLAFQGVFPSQILPTIGLGWDVFNLNALEYWGNISLLKGGVNFSEKITTVSPTYAREIVTPPHGFGFEGVLARRAGDLVGILNGIDVSRWNPEADPYVGVSYSADNLTAKREAKRRLLDDVGLPANNGGLERPVIGLISRLTDQKGFDLIGASARELVSLDATWVMLGSGERHYEELWRTLAARHPERVSATIGFDERLAHLIEAGADMFLMPSRFEPCGLNQMYSLRYGTVPIVRATGGLDDTVVDADQPGGNGVKFSDYRTEALTRAVRRALDLYRDPERWQELQKAGMAFDPSWDVSAREYVKVYRDVQKR